MFILVLVLLVLGVLLPLQVLPKVLLLNMPLLLNMFALRLHILLIQSALNLLMAFRFVKHHLSVVLWALLFVFLVMVRKPVYLIVVLLPVLLILALIFFRLALLLVLHLVRLNVTVNVQSRLLAVVFSSLMVLGLALSPLLVPTALLFVQSLPLNPRMTPPPTVTLHPLITPIPLKAQRTHWATFRALSLVQPVLKFSRTPPAPMVRPRSRTLPR
ncbi:hypothetical protein IIDPJIOB_00346 [Aeromonas veronii]